MATFKELGLSDELLQVLEELKFETPTEIQEKALEHLLSYSTDFIGLAQTGTGKTAAFGLPLLEKINPKDQYTQALILAPTRELGMQIYDQLLKFGKYKKKVKQLVVYGGASIVNQIKDLKKTPRHIITATPGRLRDLIRRNVIDLSRLKLIILDEADEMLNMGFKEEIDDILSNTPDEIETWLFSATMPSSIKKIVQSYMVDPIEVKVNTTNKVNPNIQHQYAYLKGSDKTEALKRLLDVDPNIRGVVFCRTKRDTQELAESLLKLDYKADALHGDLSQHLRSRVMKRFKDKELQVLIATDVAARGIDVNDLTHVFHFSLPDETAFYTHRSGRTARAGKKGISLSLISGRDKQKMERIARELNIQFEKVAIPNQEEILSSRIEKWCNTIIQTQHEAVEEELVKHVQKLTKKVTKEVLIKKLIAFEAEKLNLNNSADLNADESQASKSSRRQRSGSRSGRSSRNRRRSRSGRGDSSYKRPSNYKASSFDAKSKKKKKRKKRR